MRTVPLSLNSCPFIDYNGLMRMINKPVAIHISIFKDIDDNERGGGVRQVGR